MGPRSIAVVALLAVAGAALRIFYLNHLSFWADEGASVAFASLPWPKLIQLIFAREAHMSLYYFILKGLLWFGDSEIWLRGFSVACSVATIPVVYLLGRRLFSDWVGGVAAALFVVNEFSICYAQEARGYSLGPLLIVLSWLFLLRLIDERRVRDLVGWIATAGLAAYVQLFAVLMLPAALLPLLVTMRRRAPWRMIASGTAAIAVLYVPMAVFILMHNTGQLIWIPPMSFKTTGSMIFGLIGGYWLQATGVMLCLGFAGAFGLGMRAMVRAWRRDPQAAMPWALIASGVVIPVAAVLAVSAVHSVLVSRYLTVITAPMVIFAAAGLGTIAHARARAIAVAALIALAFSQTVRYFLYATRPDFRDATAYVVRNARPGDALVVAAPWDRFAYDYYRARISPHDSSPEVIDPRWDDLFRINGCHFEDAVCIPARVAIQRDAIANAIGRHARVWIVVQADFGTSPPWLTLADLERPLVQAYGRPECREFIVGLNVCLYQPRDGHR